MKKTGALLLLGNYCVRFYERQFITRIEVNRNSIEKFEALLKDYLHSDKPKNIDLPSVNYCADQLNLSPNYFGDMVKKQTGKTPSEYINLKVMELAKERVLDTSKSISEIAYDLRFNTRTILPGPLSKRWGKHQQSTEALIKLFLDLTLKRVRLKKQLSSGKL